MGGRDVTFYEVRGYEFGFDQIRNFITAGVWEFAPYVRRFRLSNSSGKATYGSGRHTIEQIITESCPLSC